MGELSKLPTLSTNGLSDFLARETRREEFLTGEFVKRQIKRLRLNFPGKRWEDEDSNDRIVELGINLAHMAAEFGEERTGQAIDRAIREGTENADGKRNLSFMPTIAELRALVPPARPTLQHPSPCPLCHDAAWVDVDPADRTKGVKRCPNYKRIAEA